VVDVQPGEEVIIKSGLPTVEDASVSYSVLETKNWQEFVQVSESNGAVEVLVKDTSGTHAGTYTLQVNLTSSTSEEPKTYEIQITIGGSESSEVEEDGSEEEEEVFVFNPGSEEATQVKNCRNIPSGTECNPHISVKSFSFIGELVLEFDHPIDKPTSPDYLSTWRSDYLNVAENPLRLIVLPGEEQNASLTSLSWRAKDFTDTKLTLDINFEDPLYIS